MDPRDAAVKVALTPSFERPPARDGEVPLQPVVLWPRPASYSAPDAESTLPIAGRHNFRFVRVFQLNKPKFASRKPAATTPAFGTISTRVRPKDPYSAGGLTAANGVRPPRLIGHQFSVMRPLFPFGVR